MEYDELRTIWLVGDGYQVIRFWNNEVLENIEGVLLKIREVLGVKVHPHPASPVKGEA